MNGVAAVAAGDWLEEPIKTFHKMVLADAGTRAALRRARGVDEVLMRVIPFHLLRRQIGAQSPSRMEAAAQAALAVGEIDTPTDGFLGAALAVTGRGELSDGRFRLLAGAERPDEFLRLLRSALTQVGRAAPIVDTARTVLDWHDPAKRPRARRKLLIAFYDVRT